MSQNNNIAIYPGSFDPITNGHLDIIQRGLKAFDKVIVAVAKNRQKNCLFTIEERIDLIQRVIGDNPRLEVDTFDGLLIDYAQKVNARVILRGLRAVTDFEYEFQIAQMNHNIHSDIETIFMVTSVPYGFLSSSIVKEVASLNGPIDSFVPAPVKLALQKKFGHSS